MFVIGAVFIIFAFFYFIGKSVRYRFSGYGDQFSMKLKLSRNEVKHCNALKMTGEFCFVDFYIENTLRLYIKTLRKFPGLMDENSVATTATFDYCHRQIQSRFFYRISEITPVETILSHLPAQVKTTVDLLSNDIKPLTEKQEKILNNYDPSRWKVQFEKMKTTLEANKGNRMFYDQILKLTASNSNKATLRAIYLQSHQFMADKAKEISCLLYVHYLSIRSNQTGHKNILLKHKKLLFNNNKQEDTFEQIIRNYKTDSDFTKASVAIQELFTIKRREIELNPAGIRQAKQELNTAVDILNEYLEEEEPTVMPATNNKIEKPLQPSDHQKELVNLFVLNNFQLNQKEVDIFATKNGIFKSQLINNINEKFYEQLDDVLIGEENELFVMNQTYYQQITETWASL